MTTAVSLLEARGLGVRYSVSGGTSRHAATVEAVHQVNLAVREGEILAIVGESGCGKSSLARALVGLVPASTGEVLYRGSAIASLKGDARQRWRQQIQLMFQDPHSALSPRRRIIQSLEEPLQLQRQIATRDYRERILGVLAEVNLSAELLQRYPHQLSGGQKQRIVLARALLCQPALIIADEPFSAVDVSEQARLLSLFRKLCAEKHIAFVLIAHDLAVVQQLADRVAVMYLGHLVELAPAGRYFSSPAHPYSQALLRASLNSWERQSAGEPVLGGEPPSALTPPPGCVFHTRCNQRLEACKHTVPTEVSVRQADAAGISHRVQCHLYLPNDART